MNDQDHPQCSLCSYALYPATGLCTNEECRRHPKNACDIAVKLAPKFVAHTQLLHYSMEGRMKRLHRTSPIKRFATKTLFRLVDSSPALQRRMFDLGA
jgi:hypothetical protein